MLRLRFSVRATICAVLGLVGMGHARAAGTATFAPSNVQAASPVPRVLVLGDSLAVSPTPDEGFPQVLQSRINDLDLRWSVTNGGLKGDTTSGARARLRALLASDVEVLVLAVGANDGLRGVSLATVEANLAYIIEQAQARGIKVLLCGMETPPIHSVLYTVEFHHVFPRLAAKYTIPLVPFLLRGVALDPAFNGNDGIHPNAAGARRIAETVWPHLKPILD